MGFVDLTIAAVSFLVVISIVFVSLQGFVPQPTSLTEIANLDSNAYLALTEDVNHFKLVLRSDCNSALFACDYFYPLIAHTPLGADNNILSQNPFGVMYNQSFLIALPGVIDFFVLSHDRMVADYNAQDLNLESVVGSEAYGQENKYFIPKFNIVLNYKNISIDFLDSINSAITDANIYFSQDQNILIGWGSSALERVEWPNLISIYVFAKGEEVWVFLPRDENIVLDSNLAMYRADENNSGIDRNGFIFNAPWNQPAMTYRIPFSVFTGGTGGNDLNVNATIDFNQIFFDINRNGTRLNSDSLRVNEYDSEGNCIDFVEGGDCDPTAHEMVSFDTDTGILEMKIDLNGLVVANAARNFFIYFDSNLTAPADISVSLENAVDRNYYVGNFETSSTVVKDLNTTHITLFNPVVMDIWLERFDQSTQWHKTPDYRLPFTVYNNGDAVTDFDLNIGIDFNAELRNAHCTACDFNSNSIEIVEVDYLNGAFVQNVNFTMDFNSTTGVWDLNVVIPGVFPEWGIKFLEVYFDEQ